MSNYFGAVRKKWPNAWVDVEEGKILNRTTGYNALIRFMSDVYIELVDQPRVVSEEEFYTIFDGIDIKEEEFTKDEFSPGSSGSSRLYKRLKSELLKSKPLL